MKEIIYYLLVINLFLFSACSREIDENDLKEFESFAELLYVNPPIQGTCIDSFQYALRNAMEVSLADEIWKDRIDDPAWFQFSVNDIQDAVIKVPLAKPIRFIINRLRIREYAWNGYLLAALHEWFHIYVVSHLPNDEAHEAMVAENSLYLSWIMRMFNCPPGIAKYLAYIGTENTPVYDKLPDAEKWAVDWVKNQYHIFK